MKKSIKNCLMVLGMSFAAAALISRWPEIQPRLAGTNWALLAIAACGLLVYQFINAGVWSFVLGSLGHRVPFAKAARVWLQSEALRWLPGGIWGYGSRIVNAKNLGIEKARASTSLVLELALTNLAWTATASLLLFTPLASLAMASRQKLLPNNFLWIMVSAGVALVAASVLFTAFRFSKTEKGKKWLQKILSILPWRELNLRMTVRTALAYIGLCFYNGLLLWLVISAVPNLSVHPLVALGIGGGAWLAGFWAIGVPGGIGVREAALAAMLAAFGDLDSGIAVAVLWRGLQIVVELISLTLVSLPFLNGKKETTEVEKPLAVPSPVTSLTKRPSQNRRFGRFRLLNLL